MFRTLRTRLREFRRQRHWQRLRAVDAAALAGQAAPDAARVLLVRHDSIGDYLLFRPWLRQLSRVVRGRGQRLTLLANALWAPLARAWDADLFDELLPVEVGRFSTDLTYRADLLRSIGQTGFGEVIYPLHVREAAVESFIGLLNAPVRVASQGSPRPGSWFGQLDAGYTYLLPAKPAVLFEYARNREFFEQWRAVEMLKVKGVEVENKGNEATLERLRRSQGAVAEETVGMPPWQLPATVAAGGAAEAAGGPYIVLFPGASARQKRWPAAHFAALARGLHQRYGQQYRLVLAGSPADAPRAARIARGAGLAGALTNRCGQTELPGLAALLAGARLLVSNDTVAAHLAAQAGTPVLVLLMGENYGKFFPYPPELLRAPCRCLFPPSQAARFAAGDFSPPARDPDLSQLPPARVLAAAIELLAT